MSDHRPVVYSEEDHCDTCEEPVVYDPVAGEFVHAPTLDAWPITSIRRSYQ